LKPAGAPAQHIDVAALFATNDDGTPQFEGMDVLIARIAPDGTSVVACVDSAEAAKKFLEAPIEKVGGARKQ